MVQDITKTYTAFAGCDIVASFNGKIIGELQAITYSISREKSPIYTMGSPEPRAFGRGKRGIAGSMVFTIFNRDALLAELSESLETNPNALIQKYTANANNQNNTLSIEDWDSQMSSYANASGASVGVVGNVSDLTTKTTAKYADEILPFDVTISFANEYGKKAAMTIYGVELLNEGAGFSIDTVTAERAYTFVARSIDHMKPIEEGSSDGMISATF